MGFAKNPGAFVSMIWLKIGSQSVTTERKEAGGTL